MTSERVNLGDWVTHLRAVAAPVVEAPFTPRTDTERCLDAATGGPAVMQPLEHASFHSDEALWHAAVNPAVSIDSLLARSGAVPMFDRDRFRAIEVWTESELSGLHALWRLARQRDHDELRVWIARLRAWHMEHTQPDNATNRPWALHVFLLGGSPECDFYAQTLLHNALAMEGKPTPLSARILLDAAHELEMVHSKK